MPTLSISILQQVKSFYDIMSADNTLIYGLVSVKFGGIELCDDILNSGVVKAIMESERKRADRIADTLEEKLRKGLDGIREIRH
jgi:hypothetical protein